MNFKEHNILKMLTGNHQFPELYAGGKFHFEGIKEKSFIVMQKLGLSLEHYMFQKTNCFTMTTICQLGIQLIQCIQKLHQIGFIHNDIKLNNILVGDGESTPKSLNQIRLIDFGLSVSFIDDSGHHIKPETTFFSGNAAFCSKNALL